MTPEQLQHYSNEWQVYFTALRNRGYTVKYDVGIIHIQNAWYKLNLRHERGRWIIELEKPFGVPDRTSTTDDATAIGRIEKKLHDAIKKPWVYSFAIRVPIPLSMVAGDENHSRKDDRREHKHRKRKKRRR